LLGAIDEQIHRETAAGARLRPARMVFLVPEAFKKPYRAIFPELYERVYGNLADKSRLNEALTEVIYDFLTRWGPSFEEFGEHHRNFLRELCDRTTSRENSLPPVRGEAGVSGATCDGRAGMSEGQAAIWLRRLADDVLRAVEQELRSFTPQASGV
jgi:hypothetical protein